MLVAYAIENLCKGLKVVRYRDRVFGAVELGTPIDKAIGRHDIDCLLSELNFPFKDGDRDLAALLKRNSVWAGRYPLPVKPDHETLTVISSGVGSILSWQREDGLQVIKDFVARVDAFIASELDPHDEHITGMYVSRVDPAGQQSR